MFRKVYLYSIIISVLICSSCSNKQYQVLFERNKTLAADSGLTTGNYQYHIKSQDILEIRNLQNSKNIVDLNPVQANGSAQGAASTQSETYQVEEDGTVALTGLGHVQVVGLTRFEAKTY
jgi:polysaccharide export outer membrane protein